MKAHLLMCVCCSSTCLLHQAQYMQELLTTTVAGVDLTVDYDTEIKPFLGRPWSVVSFA